MKTICATWLAVAAFTLTGLSGTSAAPAVAPVDEAPVRAVVHGFETAWNRHDMDAFGKLFATDADFVNVFGMRWIGRATIQQQHAATHASVFKSSHLTIDETSVKFLGADVAVARSSWTLSGHTDPAGHGQPTRHGILTNVLMRRANAWAIVVSQNTDIVPPPA